MSAVSSSPNPLATLSDLAADLPRQPATRKAPRLSSAGQSRRRHSDAATALRTVASRISPPTAPIATTTRSRSNTVTSNITDDSSVSSSLPSSAIVPPLSIHELKKKGNTFQCESCAKIYRHPSCLVKHRWEHSPHWHETSKLLLSKHQQVQLLEAAAILSHVAPPVPGAAPASADDASSTAPPDDHKEEEDEDTVGMMTRRRASSQSQSYAIPTRHSHSHTRSLSTTSRARKEEDDGDMDFDEIARMSLGTRLPEDRSLWPFFVSGGAVVGAVAGSAPSSTHFSHTVREREDVFDEDDDEMDDDEEEAEVEEVENKSGDRDSGYASSSYGAGRAAAGGIGPVRGAAGHGIGTRRRSRSRSTASSSSPSVAAPLLPSSGGKSMLGATRPARLSPPQPQPTTQLSMGHRRAGSVGSGPALTAAGTSPAYHPYGRTRSASTSTGLPNPTVKPSTSTSSGIAIIGSQPTRGNFRGVPPPSAYTFGGTSSSASSYSHSYGTTPFSIPSLPSISRSPYTTLVGGRAAYTPAHRRAQSSISSVSNVRSVDEVDEEDEEDVHDVKRETSSGQKDDDQETVDGSWEGGEGMDLDMEL